MRSKNPSASLAASVFCILLMVSSKAMGIEEPAYSLVAADGEIEVRDYEATVVAEVVITSEFEEAGSEAFRPLFEYIDDNNIAMTAPVSQQATDEGWAVSFMMPADYALEELTDPSNPNVELKEIPPRRVVAIKYSGGWSEENYQRHLAMLEEWVSQSEFEVAGNPVWARYNSPFSLWFMRRNEIHLPLGK